MNVKRLKTVSIQGVKGAFHEIAAREYFKDEEIAVVEGYTFKDVGNAVCAGVSDYGIMAIENSIAGSILSNYKIIQESKLNITGEIFIPIRQNLLALPGQKVENLKEVYSHPIAIQQCEG
jgi:prephenate dehydratase